MQIKNMVRYIDYLGLHMLYIYIQYMIDVHICLSCIHYIVQTKKVVNHVHSIWNLGSSELNKYI